MHAADHHIASPAAILRLPAGAAVCSCSRCLRIGRARCRGRAGCAVTHEESQDRWGSVRGGSVEGGVHGTSRPHERRCGRTLFPVRKLKHMSAGLLTIHLFQPTVSSIAHPFLTRTEAQGKCAISLRSGTVLMCVTHRANRVPSTVYCPWRTGRRIGRRLARVVLF